jgi:hypothetical protein
MELYAPPEREGTIEGRGMLIHRVPGALQAWYVAAICL